MPGNEASKKSWMERVLNGQCPFGISLSLSLSFKANVLNRMSKGHNPIEKCSALRGTVQRKMLRLRKEVVD